ncbi:MAG: hypothetical protein GDA46_06435 [Bdellovibrionales bacterium]|nr:hypothetical protein [Bdellovibrionales bacterium]
MKKIIFNLSFLIFSLNFFVSCVVGSFLQEPLYLGLQDSCGFIVNQYSGEGLRWDKSKFPVKFFIHESVPLEAEKNFISATDHWNVEWSHFLEKKGLEPFDLFVVDTKGVYQGMATNDKNNLFIFIKDNFSKYDSPNSQGITAFNSQSKEIIDTDILINNANFKFYYDKRYNNKISLVKRELEKERRIASLKTPSLWFQIKEHLKRLSLNLLKFFKKEREFDRKIADSRTNIPRDKVDFVSLIIHELGHVPGRAHFEKDSSHSQIYSSRVGTQKNIKNSSVMEPMLSKGVSRRNISQLDLDSLFCAYYNY